MSITEYYVGGAFNTSYDAGPGYISPPGNVTASVTLDVPSDYTGQALLNDGGLNFGADYFPVGNVGGQLSISALGITITGTYQAGAAPTGYVGGMVVSGAFNLINGAIQSWVIIGEMENPYSSLSVPYIITTGSYNLGSGDGIEAYIYNPSAAIPPARRRFVILT